MLKETGLYKDERTITSAQQAAITSSSGKTVLNFCANNYLGLSNHPAWSKKPDRPFPYMASACPPFVSSAAPRLSIKP
jgi:7-keto-8-aminopelargonate synthetase-like enzyme